jgi:Ca2+/Na+ antiporter
MNSALVVPIIGFFSNTSFEPTLLSRDFIIMLIASILFIVIAATYSSEKINIKFIRFIGCIFVTGYALYILNLSNIF